MPTKKTVDGWNISCVGYDVDSEGSVCTIWSKIWTVNNQSAKFFK